MTRHGLSCCIGLLLMLFLSSPACAGTTAPPEPKREAVALPAIKQDCTTCHGSHQMGKGAPLLKKPLPDLCIGCHPKSITPAEHKVGIVPTMTVGTLPLADNKITCITCHDPHSNRYEHMLRVPAKDLCLICHVK